MNKDSVLAKIDQEEQEKRESVKALAAQIVAAGFGDDLEALQKEIEELLGFAEGLKRAKEIVEND